MRARRGHVLAGLGLAGLMGLTLLCGALAGCAAFAVAHPPTPALGGAPLREGSFYLFAHPGGALVLDVPDGEAQVELFAPSGSRIGQVLLGGILGGGVHARPLTLDLPGSGNYVIRPLSLTGNLSASGPSGPLAFQPLVSHVERHVLAQEPHFLVHAPIGNPRQAKPLDLTLLRAPTNLRLLGEGSFESLDLELSGPDGGVVLSAAARDPLGFPLVEDGHLGELPASFHPDAVRDGHLTGRIEVAGLQGVVVLEAQSYSLALPAPLTLPLGSPEPPAFTYGSLPHRPIQLEVAAGATLHFVSKGFTANLYDPDGTALGTVTSGGNASLVPGATRLVVALLAGNATLGASAAPANFSFTPLATVEATVSPVPGQAGEYGQVRIPLRAPVGTVAFEVSLGAAGGQGASFPCGSGTMLRVVQAGETLEWWPHPGGHTEGLVHSGAVDVLADGFGSGCPPGTATLSAWRIPPG